MKLKNSYDKQSNENRARAPYMVVNPGENLVDAMRRHRQETGHRGQCIVVAVNGDRPGAMSLGGAAYA